MDEISYERHKKKRVTELEAEFSIFRPEKIINFILKNTVFIFEKRHRKFALFQIFISK